MLHLILSSPFQSSALQQALQYLQADDSLVLLQDAVIAACAPQWVEKLVATSIYVMQEDLNARGLRAKMGCEIKMDELVTLIAQHGSPHTWRD